MTDKEIEVQFENTIREERKITEKLLRYLCMIDERKIFAARGYSSLFEFLTKKYGYSEPAANRRINAARLMRAVPDVSDKVASGDLNLTTASKAQSVFRAQEKATKRKLSGAEKAEALNKIENQSSVQAERTLFSLFPEAASTVKQERVTVLNETTSRLNSNIPVAVMERFEKVKAILSNKLPNASFIEIADYFFKQLLEDEAVQNSAAAKQRVKDDNKTITPRTKRIVKSEGKCEFVDPETGRACGSSFVLQIDHAKPKSLGGSNKAENLRCYCAAHNRYMAEKILGRERANAWRT